MPTDSEWGRLKDTDESHDQQIAQLAIAFSHHRDDIERRFREGAARMQRIEASVDENTDMTQTVVRIARYFETIGRVIAWVGRRFRWLALRIKSVAAWVAVVAGAAIAVYQLAAQMKWFE
jgi:hypothetical protein